MPDSSCTRTDLLRAFKEIERKLAERRTAMWSAYLEASGSMTASEYESLEPECWSVLSAGLSGIDAEERIVRRDLDRRLSLMPHNGEQRTA
jgi:hypothetical protein